MADIFEVADWFLTKESMIPKKLQKLCYYYKAWGLALYDKDLLPDNKFEAWVHGPVNPELYKKYKGLMWRKIPQNNNIPDTFSDDEIDLLESVWFTYGELSPNAIEVQTRTELPCRIARRGLNEFDCSTTPISNDDMKRFYRELYEAQQGD